MPDFKKRLVVVDQEQPSVLAPKPTAEQRNQETEKLLTNLQKKVQTGTASKEEISLYNQNAQMAKNFIKEVDNIRANADNYAPKLTKLFNEDLSKLGDYENKTYSKVSQQSMTPMGVTPAGFGYSEQQQVEAARLQRYNQSKLKFQQEANKKLSKVQDYINTGNAAALRDVANYLTGPLQKSLTGVDAQGNIEDEFYNKEVFDRTGRKTAKYLLNFARAIDVANMMSNPKDNRVPEVKNAINQNNRITDALNNPGYLKSIGRQLLSQEVGSKLYGQYQLDIHKNESASAPDNLIDFEATQLAADAIKNLATLDYRKKLAEYTRLKQFAEKTGKKVDVQKAEAVLKQSEDILRSTESFDMDKFLKTNYRQTYLQKKEEEADAIIRRTGMGSNLLIDPLKLYYSTKAGLKTISNNFVDLASGIANIGESDYFKATNLYEANQLKYDKTGYTIGVDELGNPVESSQFRWKGADGKTHYNGYAVIESGLPVAEQMLETIALAEVGGGFLRGAVSGVSRALIGAERMALFAEKALATPGIGQLTKAVSNPEVYNRMLTFGSVYATTYPRIYAEEYNNFKNAEDAIKVAKMRSTVEALTESIIPNTPDLFKKGAIGLFDLGKKQYARDLSAGIDGVVLGLFPGASNKFVRNLGESALFKRAIGVGKDVFQEGVIEEEASLIGNHFVDKYAKSKNKDYVEQNELTFKNIVNTAVESAAAMLLTAPFMGGGTKRNDNQSIIASRWKIANDPEFYKSVTASQLQAGEITQEQAAQKIAKIDQYSRALETLPIKNLSSIRDMKTLLENKDAQYQFFSNYLEKEALLDYVPTDEELPEYTKQLEKLDAELFKTQQLADKYDALSLEDKKKIIYDNFKSKLNDLTQSDDVSPAAIAASMNQAAADYKKNKNRLFSTELQGHINDLEASMEGVKDKFKSFITNNNEGLTSEQRNYKLQLLGINKSFFEAEEVDKMLDILQKAEVTAYAPLFEIQDENDFIEALARNYVTAKTNERPLTANGKLLYTQIEDQYVNDGLFERFVSKLPEDEALAKKEELKNRFWSRVVELKQKQEPGQVFPEVATTPVTESEKFDAAAAETDSKYKNLIANYRVATERDLTEDQQVIREETVDALVAEESLEDLVKALANVQSIFIGDNLKKIAEEVQEGKTDKLVEFLEENGATKKQIEKLLNKLGKPAKETKAEVTPKTEAKEAVKVEEVLAGKTKPQIEADLKAKKEEIEKKRQEALKKGEEEAVKMGLPASVAWDATETNREYDKELAKVLQQEMEQLGKMMFDFTPEEQRVLKEYGSETIPTVETVKIADIYEVVPEPVKETAADEANESQEKLNQEAKELQPIEDIRENYVYLGITDTSYDNKTRLTDENVALVFAVIDRIEESVNSKDIRSLGYNLLMHSGREVFNRIGLDIQPKPTIEEFTEQFRVNGILVLAKNQIDSLFKFPNVLDKIKLGIITNEKGEPLFFDKFGQKVTTGTPIITAIGQTFEKEEGKGGKTLDEKFKETISENGQIAPLSMFVNGRKIVNKPISVRETNNLILHATEKESVSVGGKTFFLYKGVVYLKTENPDFPYRATYSRYNTKETAEEIVTLIEAYNDSKLNPETSTLPDYFKSMTPDELIEYIHNYAFIPKNSSKHDWGITPVTRVGETEARFLNIYKKTGATPEERKNSRKNPIPREEAVNLVAKTAGAVSKKYFDGDLEFRPFKIEGGKVKAEKAINFKAWFGDFRKSGARIDGVANRNLAFAKQDVKELAQLVKKEKVETAVPVESLLGGEAPVSDIQRRRQEAINQATTQNSHWSTPLITTDKYTSKYDPTPTKITWWTKQDMIDDINSGKYDAQLAPSETTPTATLVSDIEAEKQKITSSEFKELVRQAKFFLENPKEPTVVGSVVSKYPNLFKEVTNIEKRRQEEIKQKAPYVLTKGYFEGDNNTIATLTFRSNIDNTYAYTQEQVSISEYALTKDSRLSKITKEQYDAAIKAPELIKDINAKYDAELAALEAQPEVQPSIPTVTPLKAVADIPQNKVSGVESYGSTVIANAEAIKALGSSPHSIDMIEAGFRTRTTRSETEMDKYAIKVGDIIKHFGKSADGTTKTIYAKVTAIHPKGTPGWKGTWAKEGWRAKDVDVIDRFKDGAAAIEFEVIQPSIQTPTTTGKVEFDKLPSKSDTPTFTYAGIGSRQTPPEVLAQMTEVAAELETAGYTLNTGKKSDTKEEGADKAFSNGAKKKNLFPPSIANERTRKIANEIHPNLQGMYDAVYNKWVRTVGDKKAKEYAQGAIDLQARNTNQVFGINLDTPVDFVLFYAKETNGIRPEGGTGQAVEMARLKGIPTINMANPNWRQELNEVLQKTDNLTKAPKVETKTTITEAPGKLPNDIKEEFKGKFIYATPGAGKTTLAQGMQGVVDTDALMIDEMKRRHPEFFAESGESVQNFIYRYVSNFNEKADIDKVVLNQAKQLASQGYTVLTGTAAFIKDADIVITAPVTLERVAQRFKNAQAAETFANKEAAEIEKTGKTAQPISNYLEYYLTNKGFVDPIDPSDTPSPVPTRRGRRGSDDQYTLLRSKIYANQITEAQNKVAKRWLDTVGKKAFGEDRFIIEQFLTNPEAWATWSEAGVRLFADANFAEGYHESWHEFTQMFFKPNQREALYKEAAKIYGKLDNETLEERLAEDFRQFMLTGIMPESIQKYKQSRTLFQKLADFLKNFFTNKKTVDRYFENLSVGKVGKRVGKPEFKTLKSAKTLSLYDNNDNLINLSFEESKRYLDMIDEVFVMLGNYNATKGKEEGQGLSYLNVMYSPENIKRMYDDIFDYFVYLEDQAVSVKDLAAQNELAKIFGLGNKNIDRILDYHLLNSPLFTKEMVSEVEELEEEELSDTNILKDELGKKSQLELADALVVNIIRTIPMVDSKGSIITNPLTDAPVFGDFTENWNILKNTLSGSTSYPEMLTRIEKLSQEYPQFSYLLAQLPKKITLDSAQQLRNLFFNTMSQEKVEGVQGNFNAEGKYNVSNTGTLDTKRVRDLWSLKFNTEKEGKYKIPSSVTNNFILDPRIFEVYPEEPKSPEDVLDFLNGIGFNYSQKAQQAFIKDFNQLRTRFHYVYDKLKDVVLNSGTEVSDPFLSIREGHINQKTGTLIKGKSYDLDRLVELESKHNLSFANDMIQTADGSSQFITNPPTYQTKVVAALNDPKYKYFEDLFVDFPELDPSLNWGLVNSAYLDYLFDFTTDTLVDGKVKHKRRTKDGEPVSLEIVTLNGVTSEEDYGFNEKTINLEDPEKHLGDVRTLLSPYGRVEENNRIGDKSTTRGLVLSNENYFLYNKDSYFREGKFNPKPQIWNIIYKYLEAEARITDKQSVYDIFNKNKFFEGIPQLAYFSEILSPELRTQVYEFFQNNTIEDFEGSPLEGLVKSALITWINTSANESQDLLSKFDSYKIKGKKNDFQVTLDELKRYHTLSMIHRIEQYKLFNYHPYYYKNAKEVEKRIGAFNAYGTFSVTDRENLEYTQASLTMQKAFNDFADKTGIETLPRKGGLEDVTYLVAEDERLDSQTARENKEEYSIHYNSYAETKKKVDVQDAASLFTLDFFRKFHATSKGLSSNMKKEMDRQASIFANLLEIKSNPSNTEARDNMNKLLNEGPYFIFSVEKLQYAGPGKTPAELVPLFHKYSNKILLPSEMVDNEELFNIAVKLHASNADYLVFKTGTKIAETVKPVKLFSNGKVDSSAQDTGVLSLAYLKEQQEIKHKDDQLIIFATQFRKLLFKDVTTPEEKNLLKVYKAYIKELTSYDVDNYLSKITDKKAAVEFLVKELDKKNVSAITKDLIRVKETNGELEYAVDSIIERTLAESAIASSIRKSIIRQKFNGTQFVQFPVSLVRPDRKLKFYRIKNGKIASAEAIISFSKQYHSLLDLPFDDKSTIGKFDKDGNIINRYEALKRLNQKLKDDAFREKYKDSLTLAGVRIPVQGYNSMEKMEIVEFLPEESGQMILVPDELVVKSGGDFDIDKLFMYEPKLKNGLMLTEENSTDPEKQKRSIIQNKLLNVIKERLSQKEIFLDLIEPNNVKDLDEFAKKAPEYLSGDTNKIIKDASGRDMWTNLINPHYQLYVYQLAQAMGMVGVAAKANTFQAAAQDAKLEIVDESQIDLIYLDTHKNSEGHIQLWKIYDVDNNNKISQVISQIISGAVDIVKNDNILKNNINPNTVSVALYLNMMGVRYEDINALLRDELVYRLSKGESFQDILRNSFREQYDYYGTFNMNGGFSNYGTAKAILTEFNKEDLLTDKSPAGSLARLAQFVILQSQQNNYVTPLLLNSDFDTQSFQNFEAVLRKEKAIQKVYADKFFNTDGITGVIYNSIVSPFKIDSSFIKNFEDIFPISANKGLTNYIVDFYGELDNPWIDYENFSRRFKNGLLTSILETNMSEFEEYAQYLKVDPTIKNLQDMASEIKKEAAENGAYIPLLDSISFSGDINSNYIAPGIFRNDNNLDVDIKKEQFKNNLIWDPFREQEVSQEFRNKVRDFFRIFAYAGIISTQLSKTHSSFLEIIPEEIYTPVIDRFVRATAADISKGSKSEYLNTFRTRFVYNNPDIFNFRSFDKIPNPSLRFFRNYNLNIPQEQLQKDYPNLVPRVKENVPSTPVFPNNINPDVKLPETQIVEDIKQIEKEEAEQLAEESVEYASLEQELQILQSQLKELRSQEKDMRESSPFLIIADNLPKITLESAERETGGKVGVRGQDINYGLISKTGVSVERAAEEISENILNGIDNVKVEFSDVFNVIVEILFLGKGKFIEKYLPFAAEKQELLEKIAEVKEKIKQQPKQKVRKKFKPVEKIPGQLDLFASKDEIDKLTNENTRLISDIFSDDKPVDWNIINIINNQDDSECPF